MTNINLSRAKTLKNDEFYTLEESIESELSYYTNALRGKAILCNCNDSEDSAFWKYLSANFHHLYLKKLTCIKYGKDAYKLEMTEKDGFVKSDLQSDGDFRSAECLEILKSADIVITNPPFSLFRVFLSLLYQHEKQFLVVGNMNMVVCDDIFPIFKDGNLTFGHTAVKSFSAPDGSLCNFGNVYWYTNIPIEKHTELTELREHYSPERYPVYDNYPAIEVGKVSNIPCDYNGLMGVPITYLLKHDPERFEIIGIANGNDELSKTYINPIQYRWDGKIMCGSKVNDSAAMLSKEKPQCTYYKADNADGYLICKYKRILIRKIRNRKELES